MIESAENVVPEAAMLAQQLEHRLHARAPLRRPAGGGADANLRFAAKHDAVLSALPEVVKQALWKSVASIAEPEPRRALFALARSKGFVRLEVQVQRTMCLALAQAEVHTAPIVEMSILAESAAFVRLARATQVAVLSAFSKVLARPNARALVVGLADGLGFSTLSGAEQLALLQWIETPRGRAPDLEGRHLQCLTAPGSCPSRGSRETTTTCARPRSCPVSLEQVWELRRLELLRVLSHASFAALPAELQGEVLRDFQHAPERVVCLMMPMRVGRGSVARCGELGKHDGLAYGTHDRDLRYRVRAVRVSRAEEKALIEWLENAKVSGGRFAEAALGTLKMITASRGALRVEEYFAVGEKRWTAPRGARAAGAEAAADRMLEAYLARSRQR